MNGSLKYNLTGFVQNSRLLTPGARGREVPSAEHYLMSPGCGDPGSTMMNFLPTLLLQMSIVNSAFRRPRIINLQELPRKTPQGTPTWLKGNQRGLKRIQRHPKGAAPKRDSRSLMAVWRNQRTHLGPARRSKPAYIKKTSDKQH
jgi:hypothetical protein